MSSSMSRIAALGVGAASLFLSVSTLQDVQGDGYQELIRYPTLTPESAVTPANLGGGDMAPTVAERRLMAEGVLDVLHQNISKGRLNYRFNPSGEGVVLGTAGLAFIATGSNLAGGPYQDSLRAIYRRIKAIMDGNQFPLQPVWGATQSLVFLTELHRTSPPRSRSEIATYVQQYADIVQNSQTAEGSWCHTFEDVANSLGYRGLVATSVMALQGLGMAQREGARVNQAVIDRGIAYLVASSNIRNGQIGYSNRSGQKGIRGPGRTAGGLLALLACGQADHQLRQSADGYLRREFANDGIGPRPSGTLQGGHGSAQMGLGWAAWYAAATGSYDEFWAGQGAVIASRRLTDGGFSAAPSDGKTPSGASEIGDFANAWHALILVADSPFLQIGMHGPHLVAIGRAIDAARAIEQGMNDGAVPSELTELIALGNAEQPVEAGVYAQAIKAALRKLSRADDVEVGLLKDMLQVGVSGRAAWNEETRSVRLDITCSRSLVGGAVRVKVSLEEVDDEAGNFRSRSTSLSPTPAGSQGETVEARLSRNGSRPETVAMVTEWSFGSRRLVERVELPVH